MSEPNLLNQCDRFFGSRNFYEVLQVEPTASDKEIKKAYHKLSLLVHPDRVNENEKLEATEKFKVLGKIHKILLDQDKRANYDKCGQFDDDCDAMFNWTEYWRSLFKIITLEDIIKHEKEYIGSKTELEDIKIAYLNGKGCMDYILEMVPFSNYESQPRIIKAVKKMIKRNEVPEYKKFTKESQKRKEKRRKEWEKKRRRWEKKQADVNAKENLTLAIQINMGRKRKIPESTRLENNPSAKRSRK